MLFDNFDDMTVTKMEEILMASIYSDWSEDELSDDEYRNTTDWSSADELENVDEVDMMGQNEECINCIICLCLYDT